MGIIKSLRESVANILVPDVVEIRKGIAIVNPIQQMTWVRPETTFLEQQKVFNEDALVRQACLRQAAEIIGAGYFPQIASVYKVKLPAPSPPFPKDYQWDALEAIKYFDESNNMDEKAQIIAVELVAFGNSILNILDGLMYVPLESIEYATPTAKEAPIKNKYALQTTVNYGKKTLAEGTFIHFRANATTGTLPFGEGIIAALMRGRTFTDLEDTKIQSPSPLERRHITQWSMMMGFAKFGFCNELWNFPEASDPTVKQLNKQIKGMKNYGERVVANAKGADIKLAIPQRSTSYDQWLKNESTEFNSLLEDPALKIHTETIFAKATAEEESKLFQKGVLAKQRIIKRQIEALWRKALQEYGFDPIAAKPRLNFGVQEIPEYNIADILKAAEQGIIDKEEARQMLRESRWKITEGGKT